MSLPSRRHGCSAMAGKRAVTPAGIAHGNRAGHLQHSAAQHLTQLRLTGGAQDLHAGHGAQIIHVEHAVVRLAIPADKAGAVYGKYDMQSEHGNILQQHVISALQECGVNRDNGDHSLLGKAARHGDGVSLCNADIEAALRIVGCKGIEAGSRAAWRL